MEWGFGVGSSKGVSSWELGRARVVMTLRPEGVRMAGTWSQAAGGVRLPDLTNKILDV